ncbi:TIGR02217 family protein [Halodurantibacterium flavum]|uniref:TIGR02217 family protein n=1 Tax=Halodurantibacterium flavum TaxID=1382802 RepID=A0ABW4S423_9RHOB
MAFHEIRFPADLSFGSVGGPERRTEIVTLSNGHEERNTPWAHSRRRYDAGLGLRGLEDLAELIAFFEARAGQMHGFRWKDWADYRSAPFGRPISAEDQVLGTGDGARTEFGLVKAYVSGPATYLRPIAKAVAGTVQVAVAGLPLTEGLHYELEADQGLIRLADAPAPGAVVTAGFEFDVPVRFDTDRIHVSVANFQAGEVPAVPVVEVRL